jgi:hypothetical protein
MKDLTPKMELACANIAILIFTLTSKEVLERSVQNMTMIIS